MGSGHIQSFKFHHLYTDFDFPRELVRIRGFTVNGTVGDQSGSIDASASEAADENTHRVLNEPLAPSSDLCEELVRSSSDHCQAIELLARVYRHVRKLKTRRSNTMRRRVPSRNDLSAVSTSRSPRARLKRIFATRRIFSTVLLTLALTPVAFFLGFGTHPVIGWNLYVIGGVTNGNRAVKLARILGGCIPLDSMSAHHKKRCDAAIAPGKPLNRLGWSILHVVNDVFFPGTIAWEYLRLRKPVIF